MFKRKSTNNDLQQSTRATKDWAIGTPPQPGGEIMNSGSVGSSCSTSYTRRVTVAYTMTHVAYYYKKRF